MAAPLAVWCTTPPKITAQVNTMLQRAFDGAAVEAVVVCDEQPLLYNSSVVFFFRDAVPETSSFALNDFNLVFDGRERVHNVIAVSARGCKFLSSAGEQRPEDHTALMTVLQTERDDLMLGKASLESLALS